MGRPREFDHEKIMNKIMLLFWEKGFKGTSMDDLVKTTGLNKGSLYVCFGNKEKIFKLALKTYVKRGAALSSNTESPLDSLCNFYSSLIAEADLPKKSVVAALSLIVVWSLETRTIPLHHLFCR